MARLFILFVTAFVDMVGLAMVLPLLPYYATAFGANGTIVGILVSAFSVAQLASAPLWGRFSDRYGRRPAILVGLGITAVAYVLFGLAHSVFLLLLSRVVQGLGGGTIGVVQAYVADTSTPEQRTKSLGWLSAVTSLGAVVGPAFGSVTVAIGGQAAPGFAAAGLAALTAAFAWRFLAESTSEQRAAKRAAASEVSLGEALRKVVTHWHEPAPTIIWIYAIAIGAFYGTIPTVPLLLLDRLGITEATVGYVIMYLGGMGVVVRAFFLGYVVDRLGEARLTRVGIVLLAAGLGLLAMVDDYPVLVVSLTLMPLGTAFIFPCITGLLSRVVSSEDRGLYMGVQHTFGGASRVAFPIGAGFVMDQFGLGVPFVIAGVMVLATLPLTRTLGQGLRDEVDAEAVTVSAADITAELTADA